MRKWHSLGLMLSLSCAVAVGQGFLHVSGTKIVDGSSNEVQLRGLGLGGWLVPEGYMLQTASFANSPTAIQNKIAALVGSTNAAQFWQKYRTNFVQKRDIDRIASWGFNSIRLPMHYALLNPKDQPGVYLESGFAIIDSLLSWCEADHLYLILDLHCAIGGQNKDNISDYSGYPSLWESTDYQQRTVDLWKTIAARYATRQWIGGYDLLNETAFDLGSGNVPLRNLFIAITNAIRQVDTSHIIFAEGNWYATDFSGLTPAWDSNLVYSFHKYWNSNATSAIQYLLDMRASANRPLWLGESGENSNAWFTDCIKLMESNKIGWAWWPFKKVESVAGPLSVAKPGEYDYLLRYWRGEVTAPTVDEAMIGLNALAENLALDRCVYHPDVIDALMRQPYTDALKPFTTNTVPGTVFASNYDMGPVGIAYHDADYQNISGPGGASGNQGGMYRNDGVDIERCSDFPSNGYDVGWTNNGEDLTFTIAVQTAGTYALSARVAAPSAGGYLLLRIDGNIVNGYVGVPASGGWQSWQTVACGNVNLTAGTHTFTVGIPIAGYNISYVQFSATTAVAGDNAIPAVLSLGQNYPNPFNPSTGLQFTVPSNGQASVKVYTLLGAEAATLFDGPAIAGQVYQINFNGAHFASGIYLARLRFGDREIVRRMMLVK